MSRKKWSSLLNKRTSADKILSRCIARHGLLDFTNDALCNQDRWESVAPIIFDTKPIPCHYYAFHFCCKFWHTFGISEYKISPDSTLGKLLAQYKIEFADLLPKKRALTRRSFNFIKSIKPKKIGLLTYSTANYGDDIQSIAAKQFLPRVDYYIDRDRMDRQKYIFADISVILNGWFMFPVNKTVYWPPPSNMRPLFTAFHMVNIFQVAAKMFSEQSKQYFKKFGPIGCRDWNTVHALQSLGIDAYYSGCLTLTLGKRDIPRSNKIIFCDPFGHDGKWHYPLPGDSSFDEDIWRKIPKEIKANSEFLTHQIRNTTKTTPEERIAKAEALLDKYAGAKLVVTSRLHCALPCLAFNTPVLFISKIREADTRHTGLSDLLRSVDLEDVRKKGLSIDLDNISSNPVDITAMAAQLRNTVNGFIQTA